MKIPVNIKQNMRYYKFEDHFKCPRCKQTAAKFVYLKVDGDILHFVYNCKKCGESFNDTLTYSELLGLHNKYMGTRDRAEVERYWLYECFQLGLYFDTVFQHETDKIDYNNIICKLNRDTSGWRGYWYGMKYAA